MKVAITGASGFIIRTLLDKDLLSKFSLRYITRKNDFYIQGAERFQVDLTRQDADLLSFFCGVTLVINGAAEVNHEAKMYKTNVDGTKYLLDALKKSRVECSDVVHWIQLSSCGAYGITANQENNLNINESTPSNPQNEYERTKTKADDLIIEFAKYNPWFKYTIIRPTIVFGPSMRSNALLKIIKLVRRGLFFYIDSKESIANYVHVDDVVNAIEASFLNEHAYNEVFIVANDCKFRDLLNAIASELKVRPPFVVVNKKLMQFLIRMIGLFIDSPIKEQQLNVLTRRVEFSSQKIRDRLGWRPIASVPDQIKQYVNLLNE